MLKQTDDGDHTHICIPMHSEATTLSSIGLVNEGSATVLLTSVDAGADGLRIEDFFVTPESRMSTLPSQGGPWPKGASDDRDIAASQRVWVSVKLRNLTTTPITHSGFDVKYSTNGREGRLHAGSKFTVMGQGQASCKDRP